MNTCKTCKWWNIKDREYGKIERRECLNKKLSYTNNYIDGLNPDDTEGYSARIVTGPDFGCIHYEHMQNL